MIAYPCLFASKALHLPQLFRLRS